MQTERTGKTFAAEIVGLACRTRILPVTTGHLDRHQRPKVCSRPALRIAGASLDALEAYHTKEVEQGRIISNQPVHD